MAKYVPYSKVKQSYQVSPQTVRGWAQRGQINYKTIQNSNRKTWLYDIESIGNLIDESTRATEESSTKGNTDRTIIYCRVSSRKQSADLERQKELLIKAFPTAEVIADIGSGLNYKRPGFSKLVRRICRDEISRVVVTFRDRLLRFGYELFKQLCDEHSTQLMVYGFGKDVESGHHSETHDDSELKEDLLSIVNVFVARNNGKRSAFLRKQRHLSENKTTTDCGSQGSIIPDSDPKSQTQTNDERK